MMCYLDCCVEELKIRSTREDEDREKVKGYTSQ